jgi:hypothetical protein
MKYKLSAALLLFFIAIFHIPAQEARPDWIRRKPQNTADTIYVVGMSEAMNSEAAALEAAKKSAGVEVARFFSESIESRLNEESDYTNISGALSDDYRLETSVNAYANTIVSQVETTEHWTEKNSANKWTAWVLARTDRQTILDNIKAYPDTISARYHGLLTPQDSVDNSLRLWAHILNELNKNPLDKMLAYYDGSEGRLSLFNYCSVQIQNIVSGIHFALPPHIKLQQGEPLNAVINLSSDTLQSIGPIRCRVRITDGNNIMQETLRAVGQDNSFSAYLQTEKLAVGNYNIALELLVNEIAPSIRQNPSSGFSFEVTPITASLVVAFTGDDINESDRIYAKEKLSNSIQKGLHDNKIPISIMENGKYIFDIKVYMTIRSNGTISAKGSIALLRDGHPVGKTLEFNKTDSKIEVLFDTFLYKYISADKEFYNSINGALNAAGN